MLVTPDEFNNSTTSTPEASGYKISDGSYYDPVDRKSKNFEATAHTHPEGSYPSGGYPPGDLEYQQIKHPHKPGFVIGAANNLVSGFGGGERWQAVDHSSQKKLRLKD